MSESSDTSSSEVEPLPLENEGAPERLRPLRRFLHNLRPAGWAQAAVILVGGFILTLGLINAVRAKDVTALVIAGAIILVFGLVFPAEFGFSWGDAKAFAKRADERLQEAEQADSPEEWREAIADLRAELKTARDARPAAGRARNAPAASSVGEFGKTRAWHSFQGLSSVALKLRTWTASSDRFTCTVKTPGGETSSVSTGLPLMPAVFGQLTTVVYPDDFRGSSPLSPGLYEVEWRPGALSADPATSLTQLLGRFATPPLAADTFTIP